MILDTYKDKTNACVLGINPYRVQREGLIVDGGNEGRRRRADSGVFSLTWDNKWYTEAKIYDDYDNSAKGIALSANANASLLFYWPELHRQVRITGQVSKTTPEESAAYFERRPPNWTGSVSRDWPDWLD